MSKATTRKNRGRSFASRLRAPSTSEGELEAALRATFTTDTFDVTNGDKDSVHVLVVSRKVDGESDYERQEMPRQITNEARLTKA